MPLDAVEVNALVMQLNNDTALPERPEEFEALRTRIDNGPKDPETLLQNQRDLAAYRASCCDGTKRQQLAQGLNENPAVMYQWRFRVVNSRIVAEAR